MMISNPRGLFYTSLFVFILLAGVGKEARGQEAETILLENPSFEGRPQAGIPPKGWLDCGHPGETPPDVQPYGGFSVTRPAYHGSTYMGLVTRDNKTWEGVGQKLLTPILKGVEYDFSIYLCKSGRYESPTQKDRFRLTSFDKGVVLRVWGGNKICERAELLHETTVVEHTDWRSYAMRFKAGKSNYNYIFLEAYYKTPTLFFYNGNLLVDNASEIVPVEKPKELVADNPKKVDPIVEVPRDTKKTNLQPTPPLVRVDKEENKGNFDPSIRSKDLKVGQTFRLQKLYFKADSSTLDREAQNTLLELVDFLRNNPNVSIEIGGHTNGIPPHAYCDKLSGERAKNVALFIIENNIERRRIAHKGYGKRKPIASDDTRGGQEKNQRVEIKITQIQK